MQNISSKDFYHETKYNLDTKNQLWMSIIADSHDNWCDCNYPFGHLLSSIFPPGHQDRDKSINFILARDYTEKCLSGGRGEGNHGSPGLDTEKEDTQQIKEEREDLADAELDALMAAAAAAEEEAR